MWEDGECWIIGGGPSVLEQFGVPEDLARKIKEREEPLHAMSPYMEAIHDRHVIGVNMAYRIGHWIDVVFFGDCGWYLWHRKQLAKFPGLKVSCCPRFAGRKEGDPERIKFVQKCRKVKRGITTERDSVAWNGNSGAAAISLARHFGVRRIVLLGFDMKTDAEKVTHWHGYHVEKYSGKVDRRGNPKPRPTRLPFGRHLRGFPKIAEDAKRMGIEIINASPKSAIDAFPKASVKELLR